MELIFIAGPFRAPTPWEVEQNVRRAESLALEVWRFGAACICPHMNTRHFQDAAPDAVWLDGAVEMMKRCDAVLLVPGWEHADSAGTRNEIQQAQEHGLPIFETIDSLRDWLFNGRGCLDV